jgi:hypothetical protein
LLRPLTTQTGDITLSGGNALLPAPEFMDTTVDPTKGQVPFAVSVSGTGAAPEVTATAMVLDLLQGFVPAPAPRYLNSSGAVASWAAVGSAGGFVNLTPGLYMFNFDFRGATCAPSAGIAGYARAGSTGGSPGTVAFYVTVRGGYVLAPIEVSCGSAK